MIFAERRFAAVTGVFMAVVFFLCVFEYRFLTAAAIFSGAFFTVFAALLFISVKSGHKKASAFCAGALLFFLAAAAAVVFCCLYFNIKQKTPEQYPQKYKDTPVLIKGEIKNVSSLSYMSSFDLSVFEINGEKTPRFNLKLSIYGEIGAGDDEIGDILETRAVFKNIGDDLPGGITKSYYLSGGYYTAAEAADSADYKIIPSDSRTLNYYLESMRKYTEETFFKNIKTGRRENKTEEASVVYGIFAGDTDNISQSVKNDFKKSGIYHALSVSGLHLSILCGIISAFFNLLKIHKKIICAAVILCCLFFMAFTGFSLPIIRSGIMMILFYAAFLAGRKSDPFTSLFAAGAFIVLLNPNNVLNLGFQLSFFATLGIISAAGINKQIMQKLDETVPYKIPAGILKFIVSSLLVSLSATVFTLPFVSYSFKTLSLISPLANLVTAPLITAVLFLALCLLILSFLSLAPILAGFLNIFSLPAYFITKLLLILTKILASFKYSYISVESTNGTGFYIFSAVFLIFVIFCLLLPPLFSESRIKKIIKPVLYSLTALSFLFLAGSLIYPRIIFKNSARFAYYSDDKNQNIIMFHNDYDYADIIDITHGTTSHVRPVYNIMTQNGALKINSVILTDYRKRHVQMIKKYMSYSNIRRIYVPEPKNEYDTEVFNLLYLASADGDTGFEMVNYGNHLELDGITIHLTAFDYNKSAHLAIETDYAGVKLLYLGIGYREAYRANTDIKNKEYDVVFYGTHKHNKRDDDYVSDTAGKYAGVLSNYTDGAGNIKTQKLDAQAISAYLSGSVLFYTGDFDFIVFEARKNGEIRHYIK